MSNSAASGSAPAGPGADWSEQVRGRLVRSAAAVGLRLDSVAVTVSPALRVAIDGAEPVAVAWWAQDGRFWVDGSAPACGRMAAWAAGNWAARHRAIAAAGEDWTALAEDSI